MTLKLNGTNSEAAPAYAGDDADTGLQCGTNELKLVTGGTARATVDSSGNLGLGTSSPTGFSGYTVLDINNATNGAIIDLSQGDAMKGRLVATSSSMTTETASGVPILFSPAGTEEARFLVGGGLTFNGDTAAANALDDYEEGDWNITNNGDSTGVISSSHCKYTKIGRMVTCHFVIVVSNAFTSASLAGLPFNPANVSGSPSGVHNLIPVRSTSGTYFFQINQGGDTMTVLGASGGGHAPLSSGNSPYRGTFTFQI